MINIDIKDKQSLSKKIVAIVANGEAVNSSFALEALKASSPVIAADGGAAICREMGVIPDLIIGDCDSLRPEWKEYSPQVKIIPVADQDSTDMEKALNFTRSLAPDRVRIFSAFGKRMDHTPANMLFLGQFNKDIPVEIYDNQGIMTILNPGKHEIKFKKGQPVSFFSFAPIKNLFLKGFLYPLQGQSYDPYFVGISNVCEKIPCQVSFDSGILFMYEILSES